MTVTKMLDTRARKKFDSLFDKTARVFLSRGLRPNHITTAALVVGLGAGVALYFTPVPAVGLLWLSGFLDAVDGSMARQGKTSSASGALYDIICDRLVELSVFWALALRHPESLLAMLGLMTAILLSMTAFLTTGILAPKSGEKSFYYQAGLMERTEGFILSTFMMVFQKWLVPITWVYAALIGITIAQRLWEAAKLIKGKDSK